MDFCAPMAKLFIYIFNFIFGIAGIAFVGLGMYLALSMKVYLNFLEESLPEGEQNFSILNYSILILGFVLLMISFLGCYALCTEGKCLVRTFAVLLSFILLAQVALAVGVYIFKDDAYNVIEGGMREKLTDYQKGRNDNISRFWNKVQEQFTCCGIESPDDWKNDTIPDTCCQNERSTCKKTSEDLHQTGCLKEFKEYVKENMLILGGIGVGIACAQLFAIIAGCVLAKRMRDKYDSI